jgi:hypothetical protein
MKSILVAGIVAAFSLASALAMADEKPPPNAKPLSTIVKHLEQMHYTPITEIEFDDGHWEADAYKNGQKHDIHIDPVSGKIISNRIDKSD